MKIIKKKSLKIPEIQIINYQKFSDERGYFTEIFRKNEMFDFDVLQINESFSKKNTFRGFHFQWDPFQEKIVRCVKGQMIDFALDIRENSKTFGHIVGFEMNGDIKADSGEWVYVPKGFAHGIVFLEDTLIEYLCNGEWAKDNEASISPFAKDINWSLCDENLKMKFDEILGGNPLITEKDKNGLTLEEWEKNPNSQCFKS